MTSPWYFETTHFGKVLHAVEPDGTRHTVAFGDMNSAAGIALLNAMVRDLSTSTQKGSTDEQRQQIR